MVLELLLWYGWWPYQKDGLKIASMSKFTSSSLFIAASIVACYLVNNWPSIPCSPLERVNSILYHRLCCRCYRYNNSTRKTQELPNVYASVNRPLWCAGSPFALYGMVCCDVLSPVIPPDNVGISLQQSPHTLSIKGAHNVDQTMLYKIYEREALCNILRVVDLFELEFCKIHISIIKPWTVLTIFILCVCVCVWVYQHGLVDR